MHPHVTVATVVQQDEKFLFVREQANNEIVINQPAGHLEPGETLIEAAQREAYEETGWRIEITGYLGVSQFTSPVNGVTYIRHSFAGKPLERDPSPNLDEEIIEAVWLTLPELQNTQDKLRSPMVVHDVERYVKGETQSLEMCSVLSR